MKRIIIIFIVVLGSCGFWANVKADEIINPGENKNLGLETNPFDNPKNFISQESNDTIKPMYEKNNNGIQNISNMFLLNKLAKGGFVYKYQIPTKSNFTLNATLYTPYYQSQINNVLNAFTLTDASPINFLDAHVMGTSIADYNKIDGYGNKNSTWQLSVGISRQYFAYQRATKMYLTTDGTNKQNLWDSNALTPSLDTIMSAFDGRKIDVAKINVIYTASTRNLNIKITSNGKVDARSSSIPSKIKNITLGYINIGSTKSASGNVGVENLKVNIPIDTSKVVKTNVVYKNSRGDELAPKSTLSSYIGENISISGNATYNFEAPVFKGYTLKDEKREIVAQDGGEIIVTYDYVPKEIPVKIIDDDDKTIKLHDGKFSVSPYVSYDVKDDDAKQYIPKNYELSSIKNGKGIVEVDVKGEIIGDLIPIEIHVKHMLQTDKRTYVRHIKHKTGPSVIGEVPDDITQKAIQDVVIDLVTKKVIKRTGTLSFTEMKIKQITGYESNILKVSEELITDNTPITSDITVLYYYLTKLNAPSTFDFGSIAVGSLQYYGIKPQILSKMTGDLMLIAGNPALNKWDVSVQADSDFKSTIFNINGKDINIGESQVIYQIDKKKDEKILTLLTDKDKDSISMKVKNDKSQAVAGDKQSYVLTWSLRNVPA